MNLDMAAPHALDQWAIWFKEVLAPSDLDTPGVLAFMHHFADLGVFEAVDVNRWILSGVDENLSPTEDAIRDQLEILSRTQDGFAVAYFLGRRPEPSLPKLKDSSVSQPVVKTPEREIASDLSNLQIVKKVGRQLQPFLDFEKETVSRLQGKHTQAKEVRLIFNFILRQTLQKAVPKKWEQLSRKRHK